MTLSLSPLSSPRLASPPGAARRGAARCGALRCAAQRFMREQDACALARDRRESGGGRRRGVVRQDSGTRAEISPTKQGKVKRGMVVWLLVGDSPLGT